MPVQLPQLSDDAAVQSNPVHTGAAEFPCSSPIICTSMCRARGRYFSRKTEASPNADFASPCASSNLPQAVPRRGPRACRGRRRPSTPSQSRDSRFRSAIRCASSGEPTAFSVPGSTGTPASIANRRAAVLSPSNSRSSGVGTNKFQSALAQARAKAGFSDKNP